jgi:hypothetical protein
MATETLQITTANMASFLKEKGATFDGTPVIEVPDV